eukprot:COSAG04_NODE_9426_length_865_cov_2.293734_2_plen_41_part_00
MALCPAARRAEPLCVKLSSTTTSSIIIFNEEKQAQGLRNG